VTAGTVSSIHHDDIDVGTPDVKLRWDTTVKYSLGRRLGATGPLETTDLGGVDIFYNISGYLMRDLCNSPDVPPLLKETFKKGTLGAKTGSGLYDWTPESLAKIKQTRENILIEGLQKDKDTTF
jgi:3-hydroxybutyryl-CoA dehydrogenase